MKHKAIMIQGTASSVGKSLLCTALCRILTQDGYDVNPFKSQNMSLNSYITVDGHEMGRAQVMQAEAAGKIPSSKMNPILLKPTSDRKSQVVLKGKVFKNMDAVDYYQFKKSLKEEITHIYNELKSESDVVVIEGAGSPAEINLNKDDIVNMGMAKIAKSPVILVGDIDKGGVFASIVGTLMLLSEEERAMVKGVIINKFRGSYEILEPGIKMLEEMIKIPVLGVVPHFRLNIEDEDSASSLIEFSKHKTGELDVAVIRLPYMSNFTDFNALLLHEDVSLRFVNRKEELGNPDLIIIPGSKSTISDMEFLINSGVGDAIKKSRDNGSFVFGVCGGFQMLGLKILDEKMIETDKSFVHGLGILSTITEFKEEKTTTLTKAIDNVFNLNLQGYEIHMGATERLSGDYFAKIISEGSDEVVEGAVSEDRRVFGTYLHGVFDSAEFTRALLNEIRKEKGLETIESNVEDYWVYKNNQYDVLAKIVKENIDLDKMYRIIEEGI